MMIGFTKIKSWLSDDSDGEDSSESNIEKEPEESTETKDFNMKFKVEEITISAKRKEQNDE